MNHIDIAPNYAGTLMAITNTVAAIPGLILPYFIDAMTYRDVSFHSNHIFRSHWTNGGNSFLFQKISKLSAPGESYSLWQLHFILSERSCIFSMGQVKRNRGIIIIQLNSMLFLLLIEQTMKLHHSQVVWVNSFMTIKEKCFRQQTPMWAPAVQCLHLINYTGATSWLTEK